jgi:hypothetical protein
LARPEDTHTALGKAAIPYDKNLHELGAAFKPAMKEISGHLES